MQLRVQLHTAAGSQCTFLQSIHPCCSDWAAWHIRAMPALPQ